MIAAFGVLVSHKFYGPQVPILRSLRALREGNRAEKVHLRKGDELREIAEAVNQLADSLSAKSGSP